MTETQFPVSTFAQAIPFLRRPYTKSVIRFKIQVVSDAGPCFVVLFVKSEPVMDRFNIICGTNWEPPVYETLVHRPQADSHYMKVRATIVVFGQTFSDIAEATGKSEAQCEYDAQAQAFKRSARWPGPGQCLYLGRPVLMMRGEGDSELRTSKKSKKPYLDERSERHLEAYYDELLVSTLTPVYGEPLDHMQALGGAPAATGSQQRHPARRQPSRPALESSANDERAPKDATVPATNKAAAEAGYSEAVASALLNLAGTEGHTGKPTQAQVRIANRWLAALAAIGVTEDPIIAAITFALENCRTRESAQAKLSKWIAEMTSKAAPGERQRDTPAATEATAVEQAPRSASSNGQSPAPAVPVEQAPQNGTVPGPSPSAADPAQALADLDSVRRLHLYPGEVVARLAALAVGGGPEMQVTWTDLPADTLACITRLLSSAGALQWTAARLDREVLRAHHTQQATPAGRFAAFDSEVTQAVETQAAEAARNAA